MDYDPLVRRAVRRIAEAIEKYAKVHAWSDGGYRWYYRAQPEWGHIHIILVAKAFTGADYYHWYGSVTDFLKKELKDEPGLSDSIGLALRDFDQVREGGSYAIGPDYEDFWALRPAHPAR